MTRPSAPVQGKILVAVATQFPVCSFFVFLFWILGEAEDDSDGELKVFNSRLTAMGRSFPLARGLAQLMLHCESLV